MPLVLLILLLSARVAYAQEASPPLAVLDVPFLSQSESLCGGAAAAMVLRYWGERGLAAEAFADLVDHSASGIRTDALAGALRRRGWNAVGVSGASELLERELARGRPVIALIEDRPGTFHYIVVVAWHERGIVLHDPARAPFRVMSRGEFARRWAASDSWMLVVVPGSAAETTSLGEFRSQGTPASTCEQLVADGVRAAQAGDIAAADRALISALSCPGAAALRELAGVRLLERRWDEVSALSRSAIAEDPSDPYPWKLLATSRFVQGDVPGALAAWNRAGEPRLDLVRIDGLTRTRHRVVEHVTGLEEGEVLTLPSLARARRRVLEMPSAASARLEVVPAPSGLAEARGFVSERPLVPTGVVALSALGLTTAVSRDLRVTTGAITGGGERLTGAYRFGPHRPRVVFGFQAPAPWRGLWGVGFEAERQAFTSDVLAPAERVAARLVLSDWVTGTIRWQAHMGVEDRADAGRFGLAGSEIRFVTSNDLVSSSLETQAWMGRAGFATVSLSATARSRAERRGTVLLARGGAQFTSARTPLDQWSAGDTGQDRPSLLRAHPLLEQGRLRVERLGRTFAGGTVEAQHWWRLARGVQVGGAIFVDAGRTGGLLEGSQWHDADAGAGVRLGMAGLRGVVRIDLAKGMRDGSTVLSAVYEP